jgi:hypothetical protein
MLIIDHLYFFTALALEVGGCSLVTLTGYGTRSEDLKNRETCFHLLNKNYLKLFSKTPRKL